MTDAQGAIEARLHRAMEELPGEEDRERARRHEAAHAVLAGDSGFCLGEVLVEPPSPGEARMWKGRTVWHTTDKRVLDEEVICALAGIAYE